MPRPAAGSGFIEEQDATELRSNQIVGATVLGTSEEELGEIDELVLDRDGKVTGAVLSVGGFLGVGSKKVAVPWESLEMRNGRTLVANLTREELEGAPVFRTQEDIEAERERAARQAAAPATGGVGGVGTPPPSGASPGG
jgi:sporulation protein YlmC with PRC-barrel domain